MVKLWLVMFVKNGLFTKQLFFSLLARVLLSHLSVDVLQESACDCLSEIINKGMAEGFLCIVVFECNTSTCHTRVKHR